MDNASVRDNRVLQSLTPEVASGSSTWRANLIERSWLRCASERRALSDPQQTPPARSNQANTRVLAAI
jgi:hypothetical protein